MPVIPILGRWKQKDCEFKVNLIYTAKPCLRKPKAPVPPKKKKSQKIKGHNVTQW
jgi:hypothetical protein